MQTFYFSFCIFSILADSRNQLCFVGSHMPVSGYIYTGQASVDMDISMDIHAKSVDMDMDMDGKFHIHGNPVNSATTLDVFLATSGDRPFHGAMMERVATRRSELATRNFPMFPWD